MTSALSPGDSSDIMANLNFAPSSAPLRTVQEIQFGLLSPEEIKSLSVAHIEYPETMVSRTVWCSQSRKSPMTNSKQDEQRQQPREKGLSDPKLGTIESGKVCGTCFEGEKDCPGHFGHIELAVPVFHIGTGTASQFSILF